MHLVRQIRSLSLSTLIALFQLLIGAKETASTSQRVDCRDVRQTLDSVGMERTVAAAEEAAPMTVLEMCWRHQRATPSYCMTCASHPLPPRQGDAWYRSSLARRHPCRRFEHCRHQCRGQTTFWLRATIALYTRWSHATGEFSDDGARH